MIQRALGGHENEMDLETCHPRVMDLLLQLVWVYIRWDSEKTLEAAERLSETLLKSYGRCYGPLHPKRLNAIQSVAELHCRRGRLPEGCWKQKLNLRVRWKAFFRSWAMIILIPRLRDSTWPQYTSIKTVGPMLQRRSRMWQEN